jgi:uncharacterized membrane protein YqjE
VEVVVAVSDQSWSSSDATIGDLVAKVSEQTVRLVRDELRLAQAEMAEKGKKVGVGAGLLGGAGLMALCGIGALTAAAILGLTLVVADWAAALIVAGALLAVAAIAALAGKKGIGRASPPVPKEAALSAKADVVAMKRGVRS